MNLLNLLTSIYGCLRNYGMPKWVMTLPRRIIRSIANGILPRYLSKSSAKYVVELENVIVSLTSFPARIDNVWQVVECMMRQSYKPTKIILWLSKEQFPLPNSIPQSLRKREGGVFEIRLVEGDIRSHKKYYYAAKCYPNALLFLIDDDIYYPTNILERTIKAHNKYPGAVIANYGYHIGYDKKGILKPYNSWPKEYHFSDSADLFFGSGGGTLMCPAELHRELTNIDKAIKLAPIADDIWLNAIVKLSKKQIILLDNGMILSVYNKDNTSLASSNKGASLNDCQMEAVEKYIKSIF